MKHFAWLLAILGALLVAACGGGGGGSSVAGSSYKLYVTDSFRDDYDHVWLTIMKVEFRNSVTSTFSSAFNSSGGVLIDAKTLRDGSGNRFSFLGMGALPDGSYDAVRLTLKNNLSLVPTGSPNATDAVFAPGLPHDSNGNALITYNLTAPIVVPGPNSGTIDIDLANFSISGNEVTPSFKEGPDSGDDSSRHEHEDYHGRVAELDTISRTFVLNARDGSPFNVSYDNSTIIFNDGGGSPVLANGQRVEVNGYFLDSGNSFFATVIKIETSSSDDLPEAKGDIADVDLVANTFVLNNLREVEHFTPEASFANIVWTDTTVFRRSGDVVDETWLSHPGITAAEVKGTYDSATNTITATRVTLEDDNGDDGFGEAECTGTSTTINLGEDTMVLTAVHDIEGFTPPGDSVNVEWDINTVFERSGNTVGEGELLNFPFAEVKGSYNSGTNTIHATRIKLED